MLLIAGDGTNFTQFKARVDEINTLHNRELARCLGFVLDIPSLLAAADIFIGMSRAALEAMAMANPVVIFGPEGAFGPVSPDNAHILEERNFVSLDPPYPATPDVLYRSIDELVQDSIRAHFGPSTPNRCGTPLRRKRCQSHREGLPGNPQYLMPVASDAPINVSQNSQIKGLLKPRGMPPMVPARNRLGLRDEEAVKF